MMDKKSIDHIIQTTFDMEVTCKFYSEITGIKLQHLKKGTKPFFLVYELIRLVRSN